MQDRVKTFVSHCYSPVCENLPELTKSAVNERRETGQLKEGVGYGSFSVTV